MNDGNENENREIVEYWSRAGTASGRWRLNIRFWRKRVLWSFVIGGTQVAKRLVDIIVAASALLMLSPVLISTSLIIKLEDGGTIFFRQKRVGRFGSLFGMWKFRSMVPHADQLKEKLMEQNEMKGGITFKMKDDPRITRIGRFIRKYSVDEPPNFGTCSSAICPSLAPAPPCPVKCSNTSSKTANASSRARASPASGKLAGAAASTSMVRSNSTCATFNPRAFGSISNSSLKPSPPC